MTVEQTKPTPPTREGLTARDLEVDHKFLKKMLSWLLNAEDEASAAALLDDLLEYMPTHFAMEEADGGFFEQVLAKAPRHQASVERLQKEHATLLAQLDAARGAIEKPYGAITEALTAKLKELHETLLEHEGLEAQLLQDAYERDIGEGD
jgi:hemerythrin